MTRRKMVKRIPLYTTTQKKFKATDTKRLFWAGQIQAHHKNKKKKMYADKVVTNVQTFNTPSLWCVLLLLLLRSSAGQLLVMVQSVVFLLKGTLSRVLLQFRPVSDGLFPMTRFTTTSDDEKGVAQKCVLVFLSCRSMAEELCKE